MSTPKNPVAAEVTPHAVCEATAVVQPQLHGLLERFNLSPESFTSLRADAYEHQLAAHSLSSLEQLYTELLKPGQTLEEARLKCPPWPPQTPRAGALPSMGVISKIAERLRTEQTLNSLGRVSHFLDKLRSRATALPIGQQTEVLDTLITLTGEELLQARLGGQAVTSMMEPLDRLLTSQSMKTHAELERQKIALREKAEDRAREKLQLETRKQAFAEAKVQAAKAVEEVSASRGKLDAETKAEILAAIDKKLLGL